MQLIMYLLVMQESRVGHDEIPVAVAMFTSLDRLAHLLVLSEIELQCTAYCTPTVRRIHPHTVAAAPCAAQVLTQWPQSHLPSCCRPALR